MLVADAAASAGIMIPLYTPPGGTWDTVIKTKNNHTDVPIVTIVNPTNGPAGQQSTTLTAYYRTALSKEASLTIKSAELDGSPITGVVLWTVISGAGSASGYTPLRQATLLCNTQPVHARNTQ